jgi:hypothetical protein
MLEYGPNRLAGENRASVFDLLLRRFKHSITLLSFFSARLLPFFLWLGGGSEGV